MYPKRYKCTHEHIPPCGSLMYERGRALGTGGPLDQRHWWWRGHGGGATPTVSCDAHAVSHCAPTGIQLARGAAPGGAARGIVTLEAHQLHATVSQGGDVDGPWGDGGADEARVGLAQECSVPFTVGIDKQILFVQ